MELGDLRGEYLRALDCWYDYLKTGQHQYTDYTEQTDVKEIIEKIRMLMQAYMSKPCNKN